MGPSPRVRGAGSTRGSRSQRRGTIPAGTGSSNEPWPGGTRSQGPSPRVRGAVLLALRVVLGRGTIPAGAGSSRSGRRSRDAGRTIPASAGSSGLACIVFDNWSGGPSLRMLGAAERRDQEAAPDGTIPAGAGGSRRSGGCRAPRWDHPRGCGAADLRVQQPAGAGTIPRVRVRVREQDANPRPLTLAEGPSSRVQGAGHQRGTHLRVPGTIPAGAGRSCPSSRRPSRHGDHPCGCGEQVVSASPSPSVSGPSPRVRGARSPLRSTFVANRDHPASSESGGPRGPGHPFRRGHCRECGKQPTALAFVDFREGPPPRARGAAGEVVAQQLSEGTNHPRRYGEQEQQPEHTYTYLGPPPRARGAEVRRGARAAYGGTIPAGAGTTEHRGDAGAAYASYPLQVRERRTAWPP